MLLIPCPWCGDRPHNEFSYTGDANLKRPVDANAPAEDWNEYVFLRDDPKGPHDEMWHHVNGCRQFLKVRRDTYTHEILGSAKPHDEIKSDDGGAA